MKTRYIVQIGLAITLLYAGVDALLHPSDWIGFVPDWSNSFGVTRSLALHFHSVAELVLGALLLTSWKLRWVSLLVALDILVILLATGFSRGALLVTFRDFGLLFSAVFLYLDSKTIRL